MWIMKETIKSYPYCLTFKNIWSASTNPKIQFMISILKVLHLSFIKVCLHIALANVKALTNSTIGYFLHQWFQCAGGFQKTLWMKVTFMSVIEVRIDVSSTCDKKALISAVLQKFIFGEWLQWPNGIENDLLS